MSGRKMRVGFRGVQVGHADFDARHEIDAKPENAAADLLGTEARSLIDRIFDQADGWSCGIDLAGTRMQVEVPGRFSPPTL